jgi:hypothetical protein
MLRVRENSFFQEQRKELGSWQDRLISADQQFGQKWMKTTPELSTVSLPDI